MDYVIAIKGCVQEKVVLTNGSLRDEKIIPFVGARCNGVVEVGLGFLDESGLVKQFYAPDFYKHILQSWRGMKILGQLTHVWGSTLKDCYCAAVLDPVYRDRFVFESLKDQIGRQKFDLFLKEMRTVVPDPNELDAMLTVFDTSGIDFDVFELRYELSKGLLHSTPFLRFIIQQEVNNFKRLNAQGRAQHETDVRRLEEEARKVQALAFYRY